jgi:Family of unknown function (DUF6424)
MTTTTRATDKKKGPGIDAIHPVTAGQPVTYFTSGHPPRADSPTYMKSRAALHKIADDVKGWYFGEEPYQDHHGGGLWVKDDVGWFFVRNLVGIEWSGQFCADPKKVDVLRRNAQRLYAAFPKSFTAFAELGIDLKKLLDTPITNADGVAEWTDSICNASVPLPQNLHTGTVPKGGGVHNYPTPVTDIDRFRYDDFQMWVKDGQGHPAAVVPVGRRGSGDSRVRVIHSTPGSRLQKEHAAAEKRGKFLEKDGQSPLAKQAFRQQTGKSTQNGAAKSNGAKR